MTSKVKHQYVRWTEESDKETVDNDNRDFDDFINQAFKFSNLEQTKKVKPGIYNSKIHQKHTVVYPGLNLKGSCYNKDCAGFQKQVWVKKGYNDKFSLGQIINKNVCPTCKKPMKSSSFKTFGYMKAKVKFQGIKVDQENEFIGSGEQKDGELITFKDEQEDIVQWNYLYIRVSTI